MYISDELLLLLGIDIFMGLSVSLFLLFIGRKEFYCCFFLVSFAEICGVVFVYESLEEKLELVDEVWWVLWLLGFFWGKFCGDHGGGWTFVCYHLVYFSELLCVLR